MPSTRARSPQLPRTEQFNVAKKHDEVQTHFTSQCQASFITEAGDLSSCQLAASLHAGGRWRSEAAAGRGPRLGWLHQAMHGSLPSPCMAQLLARGPAIARAGGDATRAFGARTDGVAFKSKGIRSTQPCRRPLHHHCWTTGSSQHLPNPKSHLQVLIQSTAGPSPINWQPTRSEEAIFTLLNKCCSSHHNILYMHKETHALHAHI